MFNILFLNENELKEEFTFEQIYEMNELFISNKTDINEKEDIELFFNIINSIKKLIDKLNILYSNGYPFNQIINLKINKGIIYFKNSKDKVELDKFIDDYENINISFKKIQFNFYKDNQIIRFFYGKLFILLLNRITNKNKID